MTRTVTAASLTWHPDRCAGAGAWRLGCMVDGAPWGCEIVGARDMDRAVLARSAAKVLAMFTRDPVAIDVDAVTACAGAIVSPARATLSA